MVLDQTQQEILQKVLILPKASRAFLVGETETGKTTLAEVLATMYQNIYSLPKKHVRTLVVDTKPRFKAEWELSGLHTNVSRRYAKWGIGSDTFKGSYALNIDGPGFYSQLQQVWRLGGHTAIIHTERESEWPAASECVTRFYEDYGAGYPRLVFVDELADFFKHRSLGDIFQRIARNGRERNCAMIACSQRPRKIPTEVMTEMKRLYMFFLSYLEDIKHIYEFGIPKDVQPPLGHAFYMFDKTLRMQFPSHAYHELEM